MKKNHKIEIHVLRRLLFNLRAIDLHNLRVQMMRQEDQEAVDYVDWLQRRLELFGPPDHADQGENHSESS